MKNPFKNIFSRFQTGNRFSLTELEDCLLKADIGVQTTHDLLLSLKESNPASMAEAVIQLKKRVQEFLIDPPPCELSIHKPHVIFFVGVNGCGKTTTIAKISSTYQKKGFKTLLIGGDTFRSAAAEQLKIWAERLETTFVGGARGADPASVIYDGIHSAKARGVDLVLVDTSGRLQTKKPLMDELAKMIRSANKALGREVDDIFLVLDATTGQNGLSQALLFREVAPLTGIVLSKVDSSAKGGIVLAIVRETGLPIRFVGFGEKRDDCKPFNATEFVEGLFGSAC